MSESRKEAAFFEKNGVAIPKSDVPLPYLKMVKEVFTNNYDVLLDTIERKTGKKARFSIKGAIFPEEVFMQVSLLVEDRLEALSLYASCDFDPKASHPKAEDLLARCIDTLGALLNHWSDPESNSGTQPEQSSIEEQKEALYGFRLEEMDQVPYEWSELKNPEGTVFVKVDREHPEIESLTEQWLAKNDPQYRKSKVEKEAKAQELAKEKFVTGESAKKSSVPEGGSSGTFH